MCVLSMVGDHASQTIPPMYPWVQPWIDPNAQPWVPPSKQVGFPGNPPPGPTKEEFDALKKEMEAHKKLLRAAKEYDDETGQPDCEVEEKVAILRRLADLVDVDLSDVFGD